jgi:hypothetical protein
VLAHRKKWLFCKVTPVSMHTFVEGLLRLANVLEATNGTLKNVNNICTLAINNTKYFVLFSGDFTSIRWRVLHMCTTFAAFVSTGVTLAYSCVRLRNFCPHQQVSQTVWLFKGNHGGSGKTLDSLELFSTDVQCSRMVLKLFLRQGWYVRAQRVLLHFCFSLYWSKLLLEMLWALLTLFLIILCLKPLFKWFLSWPNRVFKDLSVEQIPLIPPRWRFIPTSALYWQTEKKTQ